MRARLLPVWLVLFTITAPAAPSAAQAPAAGTAEAGPLLTIEDALWAGGFVLGTVALAPLDIRIAEAVQDSTLQEEIGLRHVAGGFRILGHPGAVAISAGMYALGRVADRPILADIGLHTLESVVLAEVVTFTTKGVAGRARPWLNVRDPFDFKLGRGLFDDAYQSFPSGHTSAAFATAAAVTAEVGERWPEAELLAGAALYASATLVGVSRMYHNRHWATDVLIGAAVGSFAGWKVTAYTHDHPENRIDRWLLGVTVAPTEAGRVARIWILPAR